MHHVPFNRIHLITFKLVELCLFAYCWPCSFYMTICFLFVKQFIWSLDDFKCATVKMFVHNWIKCHSICIVRFCVVFYSCVLCIQCWLSNFTFIFIFCTHTIFMFMFHCSTIFHCIFSICRLIECSVYVRIPLFFWICFKLWLKLYEKCFHFWWCGWIKCWDLKICFNSTCRCMSSRTKF